jgi:two-component system, LytTR family, sensor kinase
MKQEQKFDDNSLRSIVIRTIMIVILSLIIIGIMYFFSGEMSWKKALIVFLYSFFFWHGNAAFSSEINKYFPDVDDMPKKIWISILFAFIYTILIVALISGIFFRFERSWQEYFAEFLAGFSITALISASYSAIAFFQMYKRSLIEAEGLKRSHMESEIKALNAQVNPHFLFNSLNTLMSIIPEDPALAVEFTRKFSDVYRYVLQNKNKEIVALKEELELVNSYVFLLRIRHGDNIQLENNLNGGDLQKCIPSLVLQILIENAAKHNVISGSRKLHINIGSENGQLVVRNNLNPKQNAEPGAKTGLENIRQRYKYLVGKKIEVQQIKGEFIVKVPLIEIEDYEVYHRRG